MILTKGQREVPSGDKRVKQITQEVFNDAKPEVKSAVMDLLGRIWLFECTRSHLTPNHRSWVSDIETAFYFHSELNDATDWQNSAIDREISRE